MHCPQCGSENPKDCLICQSCSANLGTGQSDEQEDLKPWNFDALTGATTSPAAESSVPEGLNWGAFLLPFWWSIAHQAWVWVFVSILFPVAVQVALLIIGNKIAWENRYFASKAEFEKVQNAWLVGGIITYVVLVIAYIYLVLNR